MALDEEALAGVCLHTGRFQVVQLDRVQSIFLNAMDICSEAEREAYLQSECQADGELRREVDSLLDHAGRMGDFMGGRSSTGKAALEPTLDSASVSSNIQMKIGTRVGPYKIREQIGEGGMGSVYVAEQEKPVRRKVALKVVKPGMATKDVVARFEAERQALAMMDHPSIARVFDGGATDAGQPYFAMELVHGVPINVFCDNHKLTCRQRVELFVNVCQAVEHAHKRGIIHRDLKPSNVLVAEIDGRPVAKVIDFGVAKAISQRLTEQTVYTQYSQMIGTPLYMSPEQAGMGVMDVDTRTDVYSLGVMLYELLTGNTPFDRERLKSIGYDEMRRLIREEEPKRPSAMVSTLKAERITTISAARQLDSKALSRSLKGELDWIVMKALEKDRERRYDSARSFAEDLKRYLDGGAVLACPPSLGYRVRKITARHRAAFVTTSLVALALVLGLAGSIAQAVRATNAEQVAEAGLANERNARQQEEQARKSAEAATASAKQNAAEAYRQQYRAEMVVGMSELEAGNLSALNEILASHLPKKDREDLRGWEWDYLLSRCNEARTLGQHYASVNSIAWSPDGESLATTSDDGDAIVWDAQTGRIIRRFGYGFGMKQGVDWSPDGQRLAWGSVGDENALRIWDRRTDQVRTLFGHTSSLLSCNWSPDGKLLATTSYDKTCRVWDPQTGECLHVATGTVDLFDTCWKQDRSQLIAAGNRGLKVWDTEKWELLHEWSIPRGSVRSVSQNPLNRSLLILGGNERKSDSDDVVQETKVFGPKIWVVDTKTWKTVHELASPEPDVGRVAVSPDGLMLASPRAGGNILFRSTESLQPLLTLQGSQAGIASLAWKPDANQIAAGCLDGSVKLWRLPPRDNPMQVATSVDEPWGLRWIDSPQRLVVGGSMGGRALLDLNSATVETTKHTSPETGEHISSTGKYSVVVRRNEGEAGENPTKSHAIRVSQLQPRRLLFEFQFESSRNELPIFSWSDDDRYLVFRDTDHLDIWEASRQSRIFSRRSPAIGPVSWSPNNRFFAVAGGGDTTDNGYQAYQSFVHVFSIDSKSRLLKAHFNKDQRVIASAVEWHPSGRVLAAGNRLGIVSIWDLALKKELLVTQPHTTSVDTIDWHPGGNRIVSVDREGTLKVWNPENGHEMLNVRGRRFRSPQWSSDGKQLAAVDEDGKVTIWSASQNQSDSETDQRRAVARLFATRASSSARKQEFEQAVADYSQAIQLAPSHVPYRLLRAILLARQENFQAALEELAVAIDFDPEDRRIPKVRLELLSRLGDWERALLDAEKLVELIRDPWYSYQLAIVQLKLGDIAAYRVTCQDQLEYEESYGIGAFVGRRGMVCMLAPDAVSDYEPFLKETFQDMGALHFRAGQVDNAIELLTSESRRWEQSGSIEDPSSSYDELPGYTWYFLAMACHEAGHYAESQRWFEKAEEYTQRMLTRPNEPFKPGSLSWNQRAVLEMLQEEARETLGVSEQRGAPE